MSKFFNQLNNIKAGRAKVRAYGEGGTVDALESARDYLKEKYNNPEAGIPTKVATVLGLVPVDLARGFAKAIAAPARSMTDENFNPEEEAANMAGFITTGGIGLSKAGLGPKGDVLGMGVIPETSKPLTVKVLHGTPERGVKSIDPKKANEVSDSSWFTDNPDVAHQYRFEREYGEMVGNKPGDLLEAEVTMKNPLVVDRGGDVGDAMYLSKLADQAKKNGHDGLVIKNVDDSIDSSRLMGTSYAAFDKGQINIISRNGKPTAYLPKGDVMGIGVGKKLKPFGDPQREANLARHMEGSKAPSVLYHGTSKDADFKKFNVPKNGTWFTTNPKNASDYAMTNDSQGFKLDDGFKYTPTNTSSRVIPVHLNAKNPKVYDPKEHNDLVTSMGGENYKRGQRILYDKLRQSGHDSVRIGDDTWVALGSPNQIKSAIGNRGTFDPTKPDITKASGGAVHQRALGAKLFGLK